MIDSEFVFFLDKSYPPKHSFVDGMVVGEIANSNNIDVTIYCSKSDIVNTGFYKGVRCQDVLPRKNGSIFSKMKSIFISYSIVRSEIKEREIKNIFVRNDPFVLLGVKLAKLFNDSSLSITFQNSFPFEKTYTRKIDRLIYTSVLKLLNSKVNRYLGVSPLSVKRLRVFLPNKLASYDYVPLMSDFSTCEGIPIGTKKTRFIYIGTHSPIRRIDIVLKGITNALEKGVNSSFTFVGGTESEISYLQSISLVKEYVEKKMIYFFGKIDRDNIPNFLSEYDVGLCLIPNNEIYEESSPTKLVEYMGQGLSVIASNGIPLQEDIVSHSKSGLICNFDPCSIEDAIINQSADLVNLNEMKLNALSYSKSFLTYKKYVDKIMWRDV